MGFMQTHFQEVVFQHRQVASRFLRCFWCMGDAGPALDVYNHHHV